MLWAYGAWAFSLGSNLVLRIILALVLVLVIAAGWGLFLAPRAPRRLPVPARAICKLILFAGASVLAWSGGQTAFATVIAVVAAISLILEYVAGTPPA